MTAAVMTNTTPAPVVAAAGTFKIDPNFALNQNIKVAVRLRPMEDEKNKDAAKNKDTTKDKDEKDGKETKSTKKAKEAKRGWSLQKGGGTDTLTQNGVLRKVDGRTQFHFEQIFDEETKTPLLYKSIARPMVKSVLSGKHCTVFAYGQTGSGKTFTMQGDGKKGGGQAGIIQLVASDLFRFMNQGAAAKRAFVVKVSYVEIYNEKIRDLLCDEGCGSTASHGTPNSKDEDAIDPSMKEITIRTTASGEVFLNSQQTEVTTVDEVVDLLISGNANRVVAKTDMNTHSSRSHAIFRLTVESRSKDESTDPANEMVRISDFNLVDLAGSESVKVSNTSGLRQREGATINKSLLALSTVIHNLSLPPKKKPKHINYRDSKLTRILQPHLSGNAEMAVLCCVNLSPTSIEESRSTLRFAARAKLVQVKPKVNEVLDDNALVKSLQKELAEAKRLLEQYRKGGPPPDSKNDDPGGVRRKVSRRASNERVHQRAYVMPKNLPLPQDQKDKANMEQFLKGQSEVAAMNDSTLFKLDAVPDPEAARKTVFRYMQGRKPGDSDDSNPASIGSQEEISEISHLNSFDMPMPGKNSFDLSSPAKQLLSQSGLDKRSGGALTEKTADETYDGPNGYYTDASMKIGSLISSPESLRVDSIPEDKSKYETIGSGNYEMGGKKVHNTLSWDTMDLNTLQPTKGMKPIEAMQSLSTRDAPIPDEIVIITESPIVGKDDVCMTERLEDAEARSSFFENKVEQQDELIETLFKDLERARLCIHGLVFRNVNMAAKAKTRQRELSKEEYQENEVVLEQYWLLKGAMYASLFFFITGGFELFMASVILIWLILEINLAPVAS